MVPSAAVIHQIGEIRDFGMAFTVLMVSAIGVYAIAEIAAWMVMFVSEGFWRALERSTERQFGPV